MSASTHIPRVLALACALALVTACGDRAGSGGDDDDNAANNAANNVDDKDNNASLNNASLNNASNNADPGDGIWHPTPGTSWQWQLQGALDTSFDVDMYDIDLFDTEVATIDRLHAEGRVVICYFSAGSYEGWRPDADDFPEEALGDPLDGFEEERWLDVRDPTVHAIMLARLDLAAEKGCNGVEPDNVDGFANDTGFDLQGADQLAFNRLLAREAHARGLSVGLKNDLDQIEELVGDFDWSLNEQCFEYDECDRLLPFIEADKPVFNVEYGDADLAEAVCPQARRLGFDSLIKRLDLDPWRVACR